MNMHEFLEKLSAIEKKYNHGTGIEDINIFNILFNGHEEVELHSRFISYLLSSNPKFLDSFVSGTLKIKKTKFDIDDCEVVPNKENKTEYKEIDILIINENKKQAIIIENKINAKSSIHPNLEKSIAENEKKGYQGQLERYYSTITNGEDKKGNKCKYKCDKDKTYVYYLSLHKDLKDLGEIFSGDYLKEKDVIKIDYYGIQDWLRSCITLEKNSFLKKIITQYLNLIIKITTDNKKVLEITDLIAENENYWQIAHDFLMKFENKQIETIPIIAENQIAHNFYQQFKDVKFHTVHRFFTELSKELKTTMPSDKIIAKVTHKNKPTLALNVTFAYPDADTVWYIANDSKGFTFGKVSDPQNYQTFSSVEDIKFHEFLNKKTFQLINNEYRREIIEKIIKELKNSIE